MKFPEGVSARVTDGNTAVPCNPVNGYLGRLGLNDHFLWLRVTGDESHLVPFMATFSREIILLKKRGRDGSPPAYRLRIPTGFRAEGIPKLVYPENTIRVLNIAVPSRVEHWEIAVVNREGHFYLTCQRTYVFRLRRLAGKKFTIVGRDWPQMDEFLNQLLWDQWQRVSANPIKEPHHEPERFGPNLGRVNYFNEASGKGMLTINGGQASFSWAEIVSPQVYKTVPAGVLVRYAELKPPLVGHAFPRACGVERV